MFNNQTMRRVRQAKPHIAKHGGYWRVSPWKRETADLYYEAYRWTGEANSRIHLSKGKLYNAQLGQEQKRGAEQ